MFKSLAVMVGTALATAMAADWYTLAYYLGGDQNVTALRGNMQVPPSFPTNYPSSGGTYYMWPGLQGASQGGVLQNVLGPNSDGSTWYVGSGYCCNGDPWGNGINGLTESQTFWFNNFDNFNGTWTAQLGLPGQGPSTNDVFALQGYYFYDVFFAIELYEPAAWNFGPLVFSDIVITVLGDNTSFCNNSPAQYGSFTWKVSGATPNAHDGVVDCYIDNITLESPGS